jgi:hypothetical protein
VNDLEFVLAAYGVILGVLALYVVLLWRRAAAAREASLRIRREAGASPAQPNRDDTGDG